jgi:hypothetical protein
MILFSEPISKNAGPSRHVFKIGECRVYPKTKIYDLSQSLPDVVFDDDGVFGQNIVRHPYKNFDFDTALTYMNKIYNLCNPTEKLQGILLNIMPFFRLPVHALEEDLIPDTCFNGQGREIFNIQSESLTAFRPLAPKLTYKYSKLMSDQRSMRDLPL